MIHNAYLGLVIYYIGPLRKKICAQSIPSGPTSGYAGARDIYVYIFYSVLILYSILSDLLGMDRFNINMSSYNSK